MIEGHDEQGGTGVTKARVVQQPGKGLPKRRLSRAPRGGRAGGREHKTDQEHESPRERAFVEASKRSEPIDRQ
jgi:hypothetical protein